MAQTKAHIKAANKYNDKAYWFPRIFIKKEYEQEIRELAKDCGSVNAFINQAVMEKSSVWNLKKNKDLL